MAMNMPTVTNQNGQMLAGPIWTAEDKALIQETVAKGTTESEFKLFLYTAAKYGLDPLIKQVWCVKYGNAPASIFTGRDGFLSIAHRSGKFDGMESGTKTEGDEIIGWCRVYRTDMSHPFYVEVRLSEYTTGKNLWQTKPHTMIQKVAESQCLRRAFDISGIYSPEEMPEPEDRQYSKPAKNEHPADMVTEAQKKKIYAMAKKLELDNDFMHEVIMQKFGKQNSKELTKQEASTLIEFLTTIENGKAVWPGEEEITDIPNLDNVDEELPWEENDAR